MSAICQLSVQWTQDMILSMHMRFSFLLSENTAHYSVGVEIEKLNLEPELCKGQNQLVSLLSVRA